MKIAFTVLFVATSFAFPLFSKESLKNHTKAQAKEDQKWAEKQVQHLLKDNEEPLFDLNDVLPDEDKGKQFNVESVESLMATPLETKDSQELRQFVESAPKKQQFEGTEKIFQASSPVFEHPEQTLGILSTHTEMIAEEERFERCQETGVYQISFKQKLAVSVTPAIKTRVSHCLGHSSSTEKFSWRKTAKEEKKKTEKHLAKDGTLASFHAEIVESKSAAGLGNNYCIFYRYTHKDNAPNCQHFSIEEIVTQESIERDSWQTDFPEDLAFTEANPNCRLLYSKILEGPEVRNIEGISVFRDTWGRCLFFSCEANAESPCAQLRTQGGVLVKKRCLQENRFSECNLWEKTYDLGKKAAYNKYTHTFENDEIWGLSDEFDSSYDKNTEIAHSIATLTIFSDIKKELENSGKEINERDVEIFRGEPKKCQCSFIQGALYDCCKKMDGLAVTTHLARCNTEEQSLATWRHAGQCHHVGSKKELLGAQTSQVFCCFSTKLARIVHEEGRKQLNLDWGTAEEPRCRGFSLNELQRIDFTKIDLSDAIEDVSINREELLDKVRSTVNHLQSSGKTEALLQTEQAAQKQKKAIRND